MSCDAKHAEAAAGLIRVRLEDEVSGMVARLSLPCVPRVGETVAIHSGVALERWDVVWVLYVTLPSGSRNLDQVVLGVQRKPFRAPVTTWKP